MKNKLFLPTSISAGIVLFTLVTVPVMAGAAENVSAPSGARAMLQTLVGLAVVLGLIFALAWVSRRLNGGRFGNKPFMTILGVQPLGTREKIALVEVGGKQLMLGIAPGHISTLYVFEEPVIQAAAAADHNASGSLSARSASEFSRKLQEFLSQGTKSP